MSTTKMEDLPHYTYDDYVQWEGRWELIYGVAHAMSPSPGISHQSISQHIASQLDRALENCRRNHCPARQFGDLRGAGKNGLSEQSPGSDFRNTFQVHRT